MLAKLFGKRRRWFSDEYLAYLRSPEWQEIRKKALARAGHQCEHRNWLLVRCSERKRLEVHHKNYLRLGHEWATDLEVNCAVHHREADKKRRAASWEARKWKRKR